jgi:hypothetical protein
VPELDAQQRRVGLWASQFHHGLDSRGGEVRQNRAVAETGRWLLGMQGLCDAVVSGRVVREIEEWWL